jgi:CDP-diglyceride synthetase
VIGHLPYARSAWRLDTLIGNLGTKLTLAAIVFGVAFLDTDYWPFSGLHSILSALVVLVVIFFGDKVFSWFKRK